MGRPDLPRPRDTQIVHHLSGIEALWKAIDGERYETASRLAEEYVDELTLIRHDLGWGRGPRYSIELSTPPDVLERVFGRMGRDVAEQRRCEEPDWADARGEDERTQLLAKTCEEVLARLKA